jgi:hypothetical protein
VPEPKVEKEQTIVALEPAAIKRVLPNVLTIDYCDLKIGGITTKDLPVNQAMEKAFQHYGFQGNPWWGTQFKTEFLDRDHFPPDSGFEATFHFQVASGVKGREFQAVVERPQFWHVLVNGTEVPHRSGAWWLDTSFGVFDIGAHIRSGENTITIKAQPMSVHAEIMPVYVLGNFGVSVQAQGFQIVPTRELGLGAWKSQDLPFYSDAVSYRQTFQIRARERVHKVRLGKWLGSVAEVKVNGQVAGIIGWAPYELDVTRFLKGGKNDIEVLVYGSLKNLIGPHHGDFKPGLIGSWLWRTAPEHTPPGSQYLLLGYGLFEDFRLIESVRP